MAHVSQQQALQVRGAAGVADIVQGFACV
jgi:hypothetical protein